MPMIKMRKKNRRRMKKILEDLKMIRFQIPTIMMRKKNWRRMNKILKDLKMIRF